MFTKLLQVYDRIKMTCVLLSKSDWIRLMSIAIKVLNTCLIKVNLIVFTGKKTILIYEKLLYN